MAKKHLSFADALRAAVERDERSQNQIAKAAKIAPIVLYRFMHKTRSLNVETFEKLARVVGLNLGE